MKTETKLLLTVWLWFPPFLLGTIIGVIITVTKQGYKEGGEAIISWFSDWHPEEGEKK